MYIHARRGLPFSVDVQTLFDGDPTSLNGAALSWEGTQGFAPALKAINHEEGLVRYSASAEETATWPLGTHDTLFRYRATFNAQPNKSFHVYVQVHEANDVIVLPDSYDHFGYLGTLTTEDDFSFVFNGSADAGGGTGDDGWSPLFVIESDGARRVLKLAGWTGGSGVTPGFVGQYVGTATFQPDIADGVDIRGPEGPPGADGEDGVGVTADSFQTVLVNGATALVADSPTDILNVLATTGISLTANATTDTLTINNTGVTSATAGAGITVSPSTGAVVVTNTGVLTVNGASGTVVTPNTFGTVNANGTSLVADTTSDTLSVLPGTGITISGNAGTDSLTVGNSGVLTVNGASGAVVTPNTFGTVNANGTGLVADSTSDILTVVPGSGIGISGNATTDTLTVSNTGVLSVNGNTGVVVTPNLFGTCVFGGTSLVADTTNDTLTVGAGPGIALTGNTGTDTGTISNTGVLSVNGSNGAVLVPFVTRGMMTTTQATSTGTYQDLTFSYFTLQPGEHMLLHAHLNAISTGTTAGIGFGFYCVASGVADGPLVARGSWRIRTVNDFTNANSDYLEDGEAFSLFTGNSYHGEVMGATYVSDGSVGVSSLELMITNYSATHTVGFALRFATEIASISTCTAQPGTCYFALITPSGY